MRTADIACKELVEVLTDHLERALPARERIRVEQHLVVCTACASYADQLRATIRLSGTLVLDDFGPESRRRLLAALDTWMSERR